jgi:hypothetical protein
MKPQLEAKLTERDYRGKREHAWNLLAEWSSLIFGKQKLNLETARVLTLPCSLKAFVLEHVKGLSECKTF